MRIFALETDDEKLKQSFLTTNEEIVLSVRFHSMLFGLRLLKYLFYTACFAALGYLLWVMGTNVAIAAGGMILLWLGLIFLPLLTAFIDWKYDTLILTTEKIVVINQTSLFRREIRQMNLENVAAVEAETQWIGLFRFGRLRFDLKEGTGERLALNFIPQADRICSLISDVLIEYQRRMMTAPRPQ